MKLFKVSQEENHNYDTYDSFVVCTTDVERARDMKPIYDDPNFSIVDWDDPKYQQKYNTSWARTRNKVIVEYLGEARDGHPETIICASFNAG